jgi:acyl carrier protein
MRDPGHPIATGTELSEIGIDRLDLTLIVLDVEDAFAIQIGCDDGIDGFATVGDLAACVTSRQEAKASRPRPRVSAPRSKRPWMQSARAAF